MDPHFQLTDGVVADAGPFVFAVGANELNARETADGRRRVVVVIAYAAVNVQHGRPVP